MGCGTAVFDVVARAAVTAEEAETAERAVVVSKDKALTEVAMAVAPLLQQTRHAASVEETGRKYHRDLERHLQARLISITTQVPEATVRVHAGDG